MLYKIIKPLLFIGLLSIFISGCKEDVKKPITVVEVTVNNHESLDSLIIYNKESSWEIKSTLRFKESNKDVDTLTIIENKYYQIYMFKKGSQAELGELIIAPDSKIIVTIDENAPFESINYTGNFEVSNNFLAFSKKHQNQLSGIVKKGIEEAALEALIRDKSELITEKGTSLTIVDSLSTYVNNKFNKFSDILKKKNKKYRYKSSLVNNIGNNFSFLDVNNTIKKLKDYEGKYVYIDVWATWCKPCKVEYTFLKQLEEHFADNEDLQIISVSTDRKYDTWKKYISDNSIEGVQLYSGEKSDFVTFYDIGALPRFILLNKEGKIISPDEIRPSNPELLEKLEETLGDAL